MNLSNNDRDDVLDRAIDLVRRAPLPAGPPDQVVAATIAALQASSQTAPAAAAPAVAPPRRAQRMPRLASYVTAAAVAAIVIGAAWLVNWNAPYSFAQVVDNINKAKTVRFVLKQKIGDGPEVESKMAIRDNMLRYEVPDTFIMIVDTNERTGLNLDIGRKLASKIDLVGRVPAEDLQDPIDRLRNLKETIKDDVEQLGDEEVDGRPCQVYQVRGQIKASAVLIGDRFKLWVDGKTGLPVKIHGGDDKASLTYEQFRWNEALAEGLFSLAVPHGYRLDELTPAVPRPGRIYYHKGAVELVSVDANGQNAETQFVPRPENSPSVYVSDRAELTPDGRFLAIAYTHATNQGGFPPYRILLWDRTRPKEPPAAIYARENGELQAWQFSPDGQRLYVSWWEGIPDRKGPDGHYGADVVDLRSKEKKTIELPTYKDDQGQEQRMHFAAASPDGRTLLAVGQGLHLVTAEGTLVRRLSGLDARVLPASVRISADGNQAVYVTFDPQDRSQRLFVVPLAGGDAKELVASGAVTAIRARWSRDGKRIAYTCRRLDLTNPPFNFGNETYLKVVDASGENPATLRTETVHPNGPGLELTAWQ